MKGLLLFVCAVIAHVNSQKCGCSSPPPSSICRPVPLYPTPPSSFPRPLPCPKPCPPKPCPRPCSCSAPVSPRILPPRPCECAAPIVEYCDCNLQSPVVQAPIVTYNASPVALPSCNCAAPPTLPVYPQISSAYGPLVGAVPYLNGLGLSPCLGGCADYSVPALSPCSPLSPLGLINPFLPAASPISAIAPTVSSLYPPITSCGCGCNYLKKIPIPPPFI